MSRKTMEQVFLIQRTQNKDSHGVSTSSLPIAPAAEAAASRPPVDPSTLIHDKLLGGEFWRRIPAYPQRVRWLQAEVSSAEWQE